MIIILIIIINVILWYGKILFIAMYYNMSLVFSCLEKIFRIIFSKKKHSSKQQVARIYSNADITPPLGTLSARAFNDNDASMVDLEVEQTLPKQYNGLTNQSIFIKPSVDDQTNNLNPGTLLINNCQNCKIIIMRNLSNVYIDGCKDSSIFIGPCHSTLFIRNSKKLRIRALAQQLRIQNCSNITVEGIVGVKPVLEDCRSIKFSTLACRMYQDLLWQIEVTKIDIFENQIYECYDFTPKKQPNFINIDYEYEQQQEQQQEIQSKSQSDSQKEEQRKKTQRQLQIEEWNKKIKDNELDWGLENVYLPNLTSTKKSMLKKIYNQIQVRNNANIKLIYTKMNFKQFLVSLNSKQLDKKFIIIKKLNIENSLKIAKNYSNFYKQKIASLQSNTGNWYFILVKFNKITEEEKNLQNDVLNKHGDRKNSQKNGERRINLSGIGLGFIEERELIWKLFNYQQYYE